jgi:hypothetical protein
MNIEEKRKTLDALTVILEMNSQEMSSAAMVMIAEELSAYDFSAVQQAMRKTAKQGYKITLGRIVDNIDDGRPSPEKAWQEVQHMTEDDSKVLTTEQNQAYCMVSTSLIDADTSTRITAKQTFISEYERLCEKNIDQGVPVQYFLARANHDHDGLKALQAVTLAVAENKLPQSKAVKLLPAYESEIKQLPAYKNSEAIKLINNAISEVTK